jgi:hypothetical protein
MRLISWTLRSGCEQLCLIQLSFRWILPLNHILGFLKLEISLDSFIFIPVQASQIII